MIGLVFGRSVRSVCQQMHLQHSSWSRAQTCPSSLPFKPASQLRLQRLAPFPPAYLSTYTPSPTTPTITHRRSCCVGHEACLSHGPHEEQGAYHVAGVRAHPALEQLPEIGAFLVVAWGRVQLFSVGGYIGGCVLGRLGLRKQPITRQQAGSKCGCRRCVPGMILQGVKWPPIHGHAGGLESPRL